MFGYLVWMCGVKISVGQPALTKCRKEIITLVKNTISETAFRKLFPKLPRKPLCQGEPGYVQVQIRLSNFWISINSRMKINQK